MTGGGVYLSSFGAAMYSAYFCADFQGEGYHFDKPIEYGIWMDDVVKPNTAVSKKFGTILFELKSWPSR